MCPCVCRVSVGFECASGRRFVCWWASTCVFLHTVFDIHYVDLISWLLRGGGRKCLPGIWIILNIGIPVGVNAAGQILGWVLSPSSHNPRNSSASPVPTTESSDH